MGNILLLSREGHADDPSRHLLVQQRLPVNYMGDFSILGIQVDRFSDAIRLLEKHRFDIIAQNHCSQAVVVTRGPRQVYELFRILDHSGFDCGFTDLADRMYQG